MRQHVQRQIGRADRQPLRQLNELGKDDRPAVGDGTDRTRQGNEREGLDLIELLAEALASALCGNLRNGILSVLRTEPALIHFFIVPLNHWVNAMMTQ